MLRLTVTPKNTINFNNSERHYRYMEKIEVYVKGVDKPFAFDGEYKGHERPDGKETMNWHYYLSSDGKWFHFRKENIVAIISKEI